MLQKNLFKKKTI